MWGESWSELSTSHVVLRSSLVAWGYWVGLYQVLSGKLRLNSSMEYAMQAFSSCHMVYQGSTTAWGQWVGPYQVLRLHSWVKFTMQAFGSCHCVQVAPQPLQVSGQGSTRPQGTKQKVPGWLRMLGRAISGFEQGTKAAWLVGVCCAGLWVMTQVSWLPGHLGSLGMAQAGPWRTYLKGPCWLGTVWIPTRFRAR